MTHKTPLMLAACALCLGGLGCSSLRFQSTDELRSRGEESFTKEDWAESERVHSELLRRDEADSRARLLRARSRDLSGNTLASSEDYSSLVSEAPDDVRARLYRAELALRAGGLESAEADLSTLLARQDLETYDRVAALKFLGVVEMTRNNPSLAMSSFRQAASAGSGASDPLTLKHVCESHYNLAQCLFLLKDFAESHEQFVLYSRLAPRVGELVSAEDYYLLWVTAYLSQDYETAQGYAVKADSTLRKRALQTLEDPGLTGKQFQ